MNEQDREFMIRTIRRQAGELELARLVPERAQREDVRELARRVYQEQQRMHGELRRLAQPKGIDVPEGFGSEEMSLRDDLSVLRGFDFDRAYLGAIHERYRRWSDELRSSVNQLGDPDLQRFVLNNANFFEDFERQARELRGELGRRLETREEARERKER